MNRADYRMRLLSDEELRRFKEKVTVQRYGRWTCWTWTAKVDRFGYARFWLDGQWRAAHRLAYVGMVAGAATPTRRKARRAFPEHLTDLDHRCNNTSCVRPSHLMATICKTNAQLRSLRQRRYVSKSEALRMHREGMVAA